MRRFIDKHEWTSVLLFAAVILFTRIWEGEVHGDGLHYAAVAKNILSTGEWIVLQDEPGMIFANKPPLMFWLTAATYHVLGVGTYAARFWSCAFGVALCVVTTLLGKRLFGAAAGMLAGCLLVTMPGLIKWGVNLRLETAVAFFTVLAIDSVVRAHHENRPRWLLLTGVAAGLGAMTKLVTVMFVGGSTLVLLLVWRPRWLLHRTMFAAVGLALALAAPWHSYMIFRVGDPFTSQYFGGEVGRAFVFGSHHLVNLWLNLEGMLMRSLPWWPLGALAVFWWRRAGAKERAGLWICLAWIAATVVAMSVPAKRYDRYILPAYPAIALLAGCGASLLISPRIRASLPIAIRRLAIGIGFSLALLPVPLHSSRFGGYRTAKELLDQKSAPETIAYYDPGSQQPNWALRSKAIYYLDRRLVPYATLGELVRAEERVVIAKRQDVEGLASSSYRRLLRLDEKYRLLMLPREPLR